VAEDYDDYLGADANLDVDPEVAPSVNPHPGHCRVCDVALMDRRKQYCEEHADPKNRPKPARARPRVERPQRHDPRARPGGPPQSLLDEAGRITEDLQGEVMAMLAPFAPIVAGTWAVRAEANTRATLTIAAAHPKVLRSILKAAETEAYFALGTFALAIVVAAAIEVGMLAGDGGLAMGLGIDEIYDQVMAERGQVSNDVARHYAVPDATFEGPEGGLAGQL
jgi:hypothetical protein